MSIRLKRFPADASPELRREFGRALIAALDTLGVQPGEDFYVTVTREPEQPTLMPIEPPPATRYRDPD